MKYKIARKCALDKKRIELLNSSEKEVENIEIQLLSTEDDLSLIDLINANISSIHLPLPPFCNLTFISDSLKAKDSNYDFILRVIEKCKQHNCGMVVHANLPLESLYQTEGCEMLISFIKDSGIIWHIENVALDEISNGNACIKAPVQICDYFNKRIKKEICFPLLDTCHFLMIQDDFDRTLSLNLHQVLQMYNSNNYCIHLNSRIGCGDPAYGGIHGSNFHYDTPLLIKILKTVKQYNPMLILEVYETDYYTSANVKELHSKIINLQDKI